MKYMLLWATCFVALLQFSVVTCRSAHEKVSNKENEKYSTTMSPTVAYTGQETDPWSLSLVVNSSHKLAFNPGVMSTHTQHYQFNWILVFLLIIFGCIILSLLILGCIAVYYWREKIRPGMIVNGSSHAQHLQFPAVPLQPINATQQLPLTCLKCRLQFPVTAELHPEQHQSTHPEKLPSTVQCTRCGVHAGYQDPQLQAQVSLAPVGHEAPKSQSEGQPTVVEFENPVSNLKQPD